MMLSLSFAGILIAASVLGQDTPTVVSNAIVTSEPSAISISSTLSTQYCFDMTCPLSTATGGGPGAQPTTALIISNAFSATPAADALVSDGTSGTVPETTGSDSGGPTPSPNSPEGAEDLNESNTEPETESASGSGSSGSSSSGSDSSELDSSSGSFENHSSSGPPSSSNSPSGPAGSGSSSSSQNTANSSNDAESTTHSGLTHDSNSSTDSGSPNNSASEVDLTAPKGSSSSTFTTSFTSSTPSASEDPVAGDVDHTSRASGESADDPTTTKTQTGADTTGSSADSAESTRPTSLATATFPDRLMSLLVLGCLATVSKLV
ncbi:hypothetical protein BDW75DRAFT_217773 [Aspergillus navahoensis]